ncbi:hypothetical protein REC12_24825 [Desulfosporosinus sp. PR]|uniref:hypothetical protein n=1 Tax=Candidatus Desulfosporosinus nitrosoreducens TaxID=3401928 RepID=UPI0027E931F6|nr:hypothetical protein [Desulfosporosinus sp. PR]MDQ7096822.1 hypothetical protein [Desulfosporosinus sp. PR]
MLRLYWENIPLLAVLEQHLRQWGDVARINKRTLRLIPADLQIPPIYIDQNGSIDVPVSGLDLFEREDCIERLEQWLGMS